MARSPSRLPTPFRWVSDVTIQYNIESSTATNLIEWYLSGILKAYLDVSGYFVGAGIKSISDPSNYYVDPAGSTRINTTTITGLLTLSNHTSLAAYRYFSVGNGIYLFSGADQTLTLLFNKLIIANKAYYASNFGHGSQTNPTLFVHSNTDPSTDNTQWIGITHNTTDGEITTGKGNIYLNSGLKHKVTDVNAATYAMQTQDYCLGVSYTATGTVTITLPAPAQGKSVIIKDTGGNAGTNNITINPNATETIDGAASYVINNNYGVVRLMSDGTNWYTW